LAVWLAYPSGEEGDNFIVEMILPASLRVGGGGGSQQPELPACKNLYLPLSTQKEERLHEMART
jgi:hypothetical protein